MRAFGMNNSQVTSHFSTVMTNESIQPSASSSGNSNPQLGFDDKSILGYLRYGAGRRPLPSTDPITFLQQNQHLKRLPPHLLSCFGSITTPQQRTVIPIIRNRRLKFVDSHPAEFEFENAGEKWPDLWRGQQDWRKAAERENRDERRWAETQFLDGEKQHVGKLGSLLGMVWSYTHSTFRLQSTGDYAEEREAERVRASGQRVIEDFVPEEDSDDSDGDAIATAPEDSPEEVKENFERLIRERFIYGLLDVSCPC